MRQYADIEYYNSIYGGQHDMTDAALMQASRHIDSLTYNRAAAHWDELTDHQREIVQYCCCQLAEFEMANADVLTSAVSSYSLNGASVKLGDSGTVITVQGICINQAIYSYLEQSGLCWRGGV